VVPVSCEDDHGIGPGRRGGSRRPDEEHGAGDEPNDEEPSEDGEEAADHRDE